MHLPLPASSRLRATATACALALVLVAAGPQADVAGPPVVDLGAAAAFAVLAGGGVAGTGRSTITGDLGTHPLPAVPDGLASSVRGTVYRAGDLAALAQADLAGAYGAAAGATPTAALEGGSTYDLVVAPGVYEVAGGDPAFSGRLILDGGGEADRTWIFQVAGDLVTSPGSSIEIVNAGQACHVFWQTTGSATLGPGSRFVGSIMAMTSVQVGEGVTLDGRVLSLTAGVTLGGAHITAPSCTTADEPLPSPAIAAAGAAPLSTALPAGGSPEGSPSGLPLLVLGAIALAAVMGEPRRGRATARPARNW